MGKTEPSTLSAAALPGPTGNARPQSPSALPAPSSELSPPPLLMLPEPTLPSPGELSDPSRLAREAQLLDQARDAFAAGNREECAQLLQSYDDTKRSGSSSLEREAQNLRKALAASSH